MLRRRGHVRTRGRPSVTGASNARARSESSCKPASSYIMACLGNEPPKLTMLPCPGHTVSSLNWRSCFVGTSGIWLSGIPHEVVSEDCTTKPQGPRHTNSSLTHGSKTKARKQTRYLYPECWHKIPKCSMILSSFDSGAFAHSIPTTQPNSEADLAPSDHQSSTSLESMCS